jgi:hypothetical protein
MRSTPTALPTSSNGPMIVGTKPKTNSLISRLGITLHSPNCDRPMLENVTVMSKPGTVDDANKKPFPCVLSHPRARSKLFQYIPIKADSSIMWLTDVVAYGLTIPAGVKSHDLVCLWIE